MSAGRGDDRNERELEARIRADLRASAGQPVPDRLVRFASTIPTTHRRARSRAWWPRAAGSLAAAAAAVVAVALVASLASPRSGPTDSRPSAPNANTSAVPTGVAPTASNGRPASPSPSGQASTTPSASPAPTGATLTGPFAWRPLDTTQMGGVTLDAVVARPDGSLLGLGRASLVVSDAGPGWSTTIWQSADGASWTRVPGATTFTARTQPKPTIGWNAVAIAAARTSTGYVAVGMDQAGDGSSADASAWYSADGVHWSRATVADGTGRTMDQLLVTASGLVALGEAGYTFHAGMGTGTAVWTSVDGRSWARVPAAQAPPLGTRLWHALPAPGGGYLAAATQEYLGATTESVKPLTAGVWRSADGVHWSPIAGSPLGVASLAVRGDTVVAVGSGGSDLSQPALAWTWAGGKTWPGGALPTPSALPSGVSLGATLVTGAPSGMLAIGQRSDGDTATSLAVWSSPDGVAWTASIVPAQLATAVVLAVPVHGSILVVGEAQPDTGPVPVMWLVTAGQ